MICWLFLFMQLISSHILSIPQKAIPAFQSIADSEFLSSSVCTSAASTSENVYAFLKEYDSDIRLVSCHEEKNYTDLYFYSPVIQKRNQKNTRTYNLQVAITDTHIYFGSPFIQYDF